MRGLDKSAELCIVKYFFKHVLYHVSAILSSSVNVYVYEQLFNY